MSAPARKIITIVLLALGVQLWLLMDTTLRPAQVYVLLVALVLACVPWVNERLLRLIQRLRHVTPRTRALTTLVVFVLSVAYLTFTAFRQERVLYPKYHDNQSYAVQAQIIASGRLWLPPHPHADFFDTFHVLVEPVYASMYFPGAAMLFAIGVVLDLPWWVVPILVAGGCMAMLYRVVAEVIDNFAGLLAPLWLVALIWFRHLSAMLMSHTVVLLAGLAMVWAYLRWRREPQRLRWALLVGAFAGFGAITRPADALCYAAPIGLAILLDLRGRLTAQLPKVAATIVAGAAPFLALQLVFNYGVSGSPLTSPYRVYLDRDAPQLSFGFHEFDPKQRPKSKIVQKQMYHIEYNAPLILSHRPERLVQTWFDPKVGRLALIMESTNPGLLLMPLVLAGLSGVFVTRARGVLFAILPLYCLLYLFYAALLRHYAPVVAPAVILLGLLGARQVEALWPRLRAALTVFPAATIVGMCIIVLPEMNYHLYDDPFPYPEITDARERIPRHPRVKEPALVMVRFTPRPGENIHSEPVYNWEAARIDDNPIIFAHDLGQRNIELFRYYAKHQPERRVYFYDRTRPDELREAGTVVDVVRYLTGAPATTQNTTTSPTGL